MNFELQILRKPLIVFTICMLWFAGTAQELNCEVIVNPGKSLKTDPQVFATLEQSIADFMNERNWTTDEFEENEKIKCSIFLNITAEPAENVFTATLNVVSKRPIYNTNFESTVLNIIDKDIEFSYTQNDPLEFSETQFLNNLASILGFYAYVVIGVDYDTYSKNGGTKILENAEAIVRSVPSQTQYNGWKPFNKNKRNRYYIITDYMNARYAEYREAMYDYHRLGLDNMYTTSDTATLNVLDAMEKFSRVAKDNPNMSIIHILNESKIDEIQKMFSESDEANRMRALNALRKIDPVNADKHEKALKVK